MDNLRALDYRLARLLGWELIGCQWYNPRGERQEPPFWARDPAACAELDEKMRERGYSLFLLRGIDECEAVYFKPYKPITFADIGGMEFYKTEWEARTRAAISALERSKKDE